MKNNIKISTAKCSINWINNFIVAQWLVSKITDFKEGYTYTVSRNTLKALIDNLTTTVLSLTKKTDNKVDVETTGIIFQNDLEKDNLQYNKQCAIDAICELKLLFYTTQPTERIQVTVYND